MLLLQNIEGVNFDVAASATIGSQGGAQPITDREDWLTKVTFSWLYGICTHFHGVFAYICENSGVVSF